MRTELFLRGADVDFLTFKLLTVIAIFIITLSVGWLPFVIIGFVSMAVVAIWT